MITRRSARTMRKAIFDARKFSRFARLGYVGLESRNLTGLYGRAYLREWAKHPATFGADAAHDGTKGFVVGRGIL